MKDFVLHLAAVMLAAPLISAQSPQATGCPVEIDRPRHHHHLPYGTDVTVRYQNKSDKKIKGIKFGVVFYDEAGDPHDYVGYVAGNWATDPGKNGRGDGWLQALELRDGRRNDSRNGMQFYVIKTLFADGTAWTDNGSKQCVSAID